ncbi:DUF4349 domain-containing protein [Kitasatospora sp. NPDC058965]|uniref:DUF4349 domain-containing protein n=1 Tax=Kitasatospora sp. NPDC058965 TaxID=3346682 RepID=UPI0036B3C733
MTRHRTRAAALALTAVLGLAGCSAGGSSSSRDSAAHGAAAAPAAPAAPVPAPSAAGGTAAPVTARAMAYNARLDLRVADLDAAVGRATDLATGANGYVEHENTSAGTAELVLRIPSADFGPSLERLAALGTVLARSQQADDLTQQQVDLDSRVKSQQASVDRIRGLMQDAKSLADVVSLEGELSKRESDLESLQRQAQELATKTSLSSVTLEFSTEERPAPPPPPARPRPGFWGSVGHALLVGWHALVAVVRALLVALATVGPFLLVLAPIAWVARRRLRGRRTPQD